MADQNRSTVRKTAGRGGDAKSTRRSRARAAAGLTIDQVRDQLDALADPARAAILRRFFKTGPGEYGEGDQFLGLTVPLVRDVVRACRRDVQPDDVLLLLRSPVHEHRLAALLIWVRLVQNADDATRRRTCDLYLAHTRWINNWDLVDASAEHVVVGWLFGRSTRPLDRLARSRSLWERRIAIMATFHFIKRGHFDDTLRIAERLLADDHDLIHKAVGWMLREVGNRDCAAEASFLKRHYPRMPRTMLRYAIERFPPAERQRYLGGEV